MLREPDMERHLFRPRCVQGCLLKPDAPANHPLVEVPPIPCQIGGYDCWKSDDDALDRIAKPFAERFLVSPITMRIHLKNLDNANGSTPDDEGVRHDR